MEAVIQELKKELLIFDEDTAPSLGNETADQDPDRNDDEIPMAGQLQAKGKKVSYRGALLLLFVLVLLLADGKYWSTKFCLLPL